MRQYRKNNLEKMREYDKQHYEDNHEKKLENQERYREKNRREIRERANKCYEEHPEKAKGYCKKYYKNNSEKVKQAVRKRKLKHRYNLSPEDWLVMWEGQDGKCVICGKNFTRSSDANVDHNHKTGKTRGLLCGGCNRGIGHFNDNSEIMMKAIEYLRR